MRKALTFYNLPSIFFVKYVAPKSHDEDTQRHEFIFNVLLLALLVLNFGAFIISLINTFTQQDYKDETPYILLIPSAILLSLYWTSRKQFRHWKVVVFLSLYIFLGTYALFSYGYVLPEGLLTYALVIVMSGVLLSTRATIYTSIVIALCLGALSFIQLHNITQPDTTEQNKILDATNLTLYLIFFSIIVLVTWLSSREITKSLKSARKSEAALIAERNLLELKVEERTTELERVHVDSVNQLQRFAEFGRISSSLLHDLANPLTSATLELDQLSNASAKYNVNRIRESIDAIESYIESARRQLVKESASSIFDIDLEISRVLKLLQSRLNNAGILMSLDLIDQVRLQGDAIKFNQLLANIFANAIDALEFTKTKKKYIKVTMRLVNRKVVIDIQDNGAGIPSKKINHIFEPFYTTKISSRGIGIGLAITKESIESDFGGDIVVKSSPKKGTCFSISLPYIQ